MVLLILNPLLRNIDSMKHAEKKKHHKEQMAHHKKQMQHHKEKLKHLDEKEDKEIVKKMVKKSALK